MMRAYGGGPGLDYLFARFKPRLERELGAELSRRIFIENPADAFAFEPHDLMPGWSPRRPPLAAQTRTDRRRYP